MYQLITVQILDFPSLAAVFFWHHFLGNGLEQRVHVGVDEDSVPDLLLEEGLGEVDDRVDQRTHVDHVDFF